MHIKYFVRIFASLIIKPLDVAHDTDEVLKNMLGAIIGDIVGSRFEFDNTNKKNFKLFTRDCSFTDDTICTVAVADAILNNKDYGKTLHDWCKKYPYPMGGYGGRFGAWVRSDNPKPYNSFGNGSAMRVSPVGWLFDDVHDVFSEATKSAACTHDHSEGIKGVQAIAMGVLSLRHGMDKKTLADLVTLTFGYDLSRSVDEIRMDNSFDETCQVTVPQAYICFLQSTSFEDAIRNAISIGGDSDTIGAMTGALAEACYGIPEDIKRTAMSYLDKRMSEVVKAFEAKMAK